MPELGRSHCYSLLQCSTLAFSPSGSDAYSPSNSFTTPFGSTVMSPMLEKGLALFDGGLESLSHAKAGWNCILQMLAFSFVSVLIINSVFSE